MAEVLVSAIVETVVVVAVAVAVVEIVAEVVAEVSVVENSAAVNLVVGTIEEDEVEVNSVVVDKVETKWIQVRFH